jgi:hypothetical protein
MTDTLFHEGGPEGRNIDARAFEHRIHSFAQTVRWDVVAHGTDCYLPPARRSRGLDGVYAFANPRTGTSDGWVVEAKRHSGPERYSRELLRVEIQTLREKVGHLDARRQQFYGDPHIAQHVGRLAGGLLFHHCRGFRAADVRQRLAELSLQGNQTGKLPPRVLLIGPDTLNGFAEAVCRYGAPIEYWWPTTAESSSLWSAICPPEQLACGLLIFRTAEHGIVLFLRDTIGRRDVDAVGELVWRFGGNIDVVACATLRSEEARLLSDPWARLARQRSRSHSGQLPASIDALAVTTDSMGLFERAWSEEGPQHEAAAIRRTRRQSGRVPAGLAVNASVRRISTSYPSAVSVQRTVQARHASLEGAKRFLAQHAGMVVFADDKRGAAVAAGDVWLQPGAYAYLGDELESGVQQHVTGLRVWRAVAADAPLPTLERGPLLDELALAAQAVRDEPHGAQQVRLQSYGSRDDAWPIELGLIYDDVYDLVGGERIGRDARVMLLARAVSTDEVDLCILGDDEADRAAARTWLNSALQASARGWHAVEVALPRDDDVRVGALRNVVEAVAGEGLLGVASPDFHRRDGGRVTDAPPGALGQYIRSLRSGGDETEPMPMDAVFARGAHDQRQVGELTFYTTLQATRQGHPVVALRARQGPRDVFLTLTWKGGKQHGAEHTAGEFNSDTWAKMRTLAWTTDERRAFLADCWIRVVVAIRRREQEAANRLRQSA